LKRRLKVLEIVKREPNGISVHFFVIQLLSEMFVLIYGVLKNLYSIRLDLRGVLYGYNGST